MMSLSLFAALATISVPNHPQEVATATIKDKEPLFTMPEDYLGLSYETMQLSDPEFFSPRNKGLVALFRQLSPHGVLRMGGNSSELSWWKPTEQTQMPVEIAQAVERTGHYTNRTPYAITPKAIDNLAGFLKATGWNLIYNLNFGAGTPQRDSEEAAYVASRVGNHLKSFQIGNEPDLYTTADNGGRPKGWGFPYYLNEWQAIADAVSNRVPSARFGGPDVAASSDWVVRFGEAMKPRLGERLATLSGHYYAMGPAGGKGIDVARLLSRQDRVARDMDKVEKVAARLGLAYRMTEGNSCYRGGQAGVSNAFAATLWSADYMLEMASHGNAGVNFHGGGGKQISASLGDHLPGARNEADLALAKLGTFYTPIAGNRESGFTARSVFWGMRFAGLFAGKTLLRTVVDAGNANVSAYTARNRRGYLVALVNKDLTKDVTVRLSVPFARKCSLWRMTAPSLDATNGIVFGGSQVDDKGSWRPGARDSVDSSQILLPHGSAALVYVE